jgi:chromosome segregation ATPase
MDPIVTVLLTSAAGAAIGTIVGVLLMRRQVRPIVTETELAELKSSLQQSQTSLATANTNAEDLGKQLAQRDKAIKQAGDDFQQKQQQLDRVLTEAQAESAKRSAAEQSIQELRTQAVALTEQHIKLEAKAGEQEKQLAERATQIAALHAELDAGKRGAQELTEKIAHVTAEAAELRSSIEQDSRYRSSLEARLRAEQEQIEQLNGQISALRDERTQLETRLHEERQSASRGMELLMMAQEKLAGLFKSVAPDPQTANGSNGSVPAPAVVSEMPVKVEPAKSEAPTTLPNTLSA